MAMPRFELPIASKPPKPIRVTLPAELFAEVELLASNSGIEPAAVIEHAVAFAFATRNNRRTRTKRTNN